MSKDENDLKDLKDQFKYSIRQLEIFLEDMRRSKYDLRDFEKEFLDMDYKVKNMMTNVVNGGWMTSTYECTRGQW